VEKTLNENREKVPVGEISTIEAAIAAVREAVKGDDLGAITRASEALQKASHAMAEALYKSQAQGGASQGQEPESGGTGASSGQPVEGEVVDAEFAESKD